jgi:nucleotide-binding universal stress UspA family protein
MKILVPLDGSTSAEAALPLALRLARTEKAALVLLTVTNIHPAPDPAPCEPDLVPIHDAQLYLDAARRQLAADYGEISIAVWRGAPAAAIVRAAVQYDVDHIVMTTHGRAGYQRDMFGSVADAVLRNAPMTVVVVRPPREQPATPAGNERSTSAESR